MSIIVQALLCIIGMAAISYGLWLAWAPLGFIVGGFWILFIVSKVGT